MSTIYTVHLTHEAFGPVTVDLDASTERAALAAARVKRDSCGKGWRASLTATGGSRVRRLLDSGRWTRWE